MRQFDAYRAAFYLVAFVIVAHVVIAGSGVAFCLWHADAIIAGRFKCDADGKLTGLMAEVLAAALAFAVGRSRDPPPPPEKPREDK